ncbi:hypothetical protein AAAU98_26185 [Enterocloster citroniae]|uniref:hypothetical protein n=1 Tax=Enterocloster citroniae TaxID=358743 RepID=UPI0032C0764C
MGNMKLKKTERLQDYEKYYQSCYHWAKFFDSIDMAWVYCPDSGRESELDKAMDFYLPDQGAYFVVDLVRPGRCDVNYNEISGNLKILIVRGGTDGGFCIFEDGQDYSASESSISQCVACGRYFFFNEQGSYACKVCGEYDGDHHLTNVIYGDRDSFESWK